MAIKYVPYFPTTVAGQAVLDNFVRTQRILRYRESDKVPERIIRGMPLYELTETEHVGDKESDNMIIHGECISACAYLKDNGIKVDLVYIDPPFASGADYAKKVYVRRNPLVAKAQQKAEQELEDEELKAFEEKMYGDIWDKEKYLNWMYENLMAIRSVMSENASIYVHLDYHIVHYVKILMDEIFGEDNFRNEIIWQRFTFHSDADKFGTVHETILYYSKTAESYLFNKQYQQFDAKYIKERFNQIDEKGRVYGTSDCTAPAHGKTGKALYFGEKLLTPPPGAMWRFSQENINKLMAENKIEFTANGHPRVRRYIDEIQGKAVHTLWTDIFPINSQAQERVDYATQKPEALLERIIKASSNEDMTVADFFGGSGVAAAVADKLGRKFIHADININSIQTARDRLKANGASFAMKKIQDGVTLYRNPVQTKDALTRIIPGLRVDTTIGPVWTGSIMDTTYGASPVYIPDLMDSSSRVLDIVTLNRIINDAMPQLPPSTKRVIIYYIDMVDRQELDDFIKENNDTVIEIELRDLKELLDNVILQDKVEYTIEEDTSKIVDIFTIAITRFYSDRLWHKIREFNEKAMVSSKKGATPINLSPEGLEAIELLSLDCTSAEYNDVWHSDSEIKIERNNTVTINGHKTSDSWDGKIHADTKPLRMKVRNICGDETIVVL